MHFECCATATDVELRFARCSYGGSCMGAYEDVGGFYRLSLSHRTLLSLNSRLNDAFASATITEFSLPQSLISILTQVLCACRCAGGDCGLVPAAQVPAAAAVAGQQGAVPPAAQRRAPAGRTPGHGWHGLAQAARQGRPTPDRGRNAAQLPVWCVSSVEQDCCLTAAMVCHAWYFLL